MHLLNYIMKCILILLIILFIFIICSLFSLDHFKPINSLNIKYNAKNIRIPDQLIKPSKEKLSIKQKINAELNSHPLTFKDQMYSTSVYYPFVGEKKLCKNNSDCHITAECNHNVFDRNSGIGICTIKVPDKTVFDIKY